MNKDSGFRVLLILGATVLVITGIKHSADFFVPVMLALFIATISYPITEWLRRHKVPSFFAVLLTVLVDFAFLIGLAMIAFSLLGDLDHKLTETYYPLMQSKIDETSTFITETMTRMGYKDAEKTVQLYFNNLWKEQLAKLEIQKVLTLSGGVLGKIAAFLGTTFIVLILTIFMLSEARQFGRRFQAIFEARGPNFEGMLAAAKDVQRFLGIKTLVSLVTGLVAGLLCKLCGLDFYILWGIVAFTLNFIPVVGSIIAGIPPIILAILAYDLPRGLIVGIGYITINTLVGNVLEPSLLGRRFGLSTLVVIISVFFWGWLWGPAGMLLAVPMTMILKVAVDHSYEFQWLAVAITSDKKKKKKYEELDEELPIGSDTESA